MTPTHAPTHNRLGLATSTRQALLEWYRRSGRDLPWRKTTDPYAVWVSEIMLQQTRVDTVVPFYERFLKRFPTVESLARAKEDEVLAMWSGLGYYRRARMLQSGAKEVVTSYGGKVPKDRDARLGLPGVGRYTAGAIGSIAFGQEEPVVDGNVSRVLARLRGIDTELGKAETDKRLWAEADKLVKGEDPGDLNQALMELGATVCTPKSPSCEPCPVRDRCVAFATSRQSELPVRRRRKPPEEVAMVAVAARSETRELWLVRENAALFGGLWSLPTKFGEPSRASALEALEAHGIAGAVAQHPLGTVTHVLSHRKLRVSVFRAETNEDPAPNDAVRRFAHDELESVGISALTRKLIALDRDLLL